MRRSAKKVAQRHMTKLAQTIPPNLVKRFIALLEEIGDGSLYDARSTSYTVLISGGGRKSRAHVTITWKHKKYYMQIESPSFKLPTLVANTPQDMVKYFTRPNWAPLGTQLFTGILKASR